MRATRLLYRLLLFVWPPRVRRVHGRELEALFVNCLETARRRHGGAGYVRAWLRGLADVLVSAPGAHREEWRTRRIARLRAQSEVPHPVQRRGASAPFSGLSDVLRDARFAMRSWARERNFTVTVLATLLVCLGGNTVIFSIVRSVVLKPLPLAAADRIVLVSNLYPGFGFASAGPGVAATSVPDYFDRQRDIRSFEEQALYRRVGLTLGVPDGAERVNALRATPSFYRLLGAAPFVGRAIAEEDGEAGNDAKVMLSYRLLAAPIRRRPFARRSRHPPRRQTVSRRGNPRTPLRVPLGRHRSLAARVVQPGPAVGRLAPQQQLGHDRAAQAGRGRRTGTAGNRRAECPQRRAASAVQDM